MSKWVVCQHIYSKKWIAYPKNHEGYQPHTLIDGYGLSARIFHTWREAQDYANKRACTIEVTLPHITADMEDGLENWPNIRDVYMYLSHHDEPQLGKPYFEISDGYDDIDVEIYDLKPLALSLLAVSHYIEDNW